MIRSTDRYQTIQEYRAAQDCAWRKRNERQIRAKWWAQKPSQAHQD